MSAETPEPSLRQRLAAVEPEGQRPRLVRSWAAGEVTALDLSIEGGMALVGTRGGEVTGWLLPEALLERRWLAPPEGEDGPVVAVGLWWSHAWAVWRRGEELWLTDLTRGQQVGALPVQASRLEGLAFPREQDWLLLALDDGSYARWLPPDGALEPLETAPAQLDPVVQAARWAEVGLPPGAELGTRDAQVVRVESLPGPASLSADGGTLLALVGGRLGLWHSDAIAVVSMWRSPAVITALSVSPDGRLVALEAPEGIEVRDAATGTVLVPASSQRAPGAWAPFAPGEPSMVELDGFVACALGPEGRWLYALLGGGYQILRADLDPFRQGRMLDSRLERMLRADPHSPDALLARAELAALGGRWSRSADLLGMAEQAGAAVHPADRLRALAMAGRVAGARELRGRVVTRLQDDPAVVAWSAWLDRQP